MTKVLYGERIGKRARLRVGCSAAIFDRHRDKLVLIRRADNGQWCLPGGGMDAGESIVEACAREVLEETGLVVEVGRLIGAYTSPDVLLAYADGNEVQVVGLLFEATVVGGELQVSDEATAFGYFSHAEIEDMDLLPLHYDRIRDAFVGQEAAFVR
jgi:8-oxo-dGTP pyrophosphatase MutT (NUDIX family)